MKPLAVVTGSSGFIGRHLVKHLMTRGYEVREMDIVNYPVGQDICEDPLLWYPSDPFLGVDYVFHLAGLADIVPSIANPTEYFLTNVGGTINVLEAARKAGVKKVVYAASSSCYGDNPVRIPTPEAVPLNPKYPYALSKMLGEQACMHWHQVYGLPCNSLRLFNVYGRGQHKSCYGAVFSTFMAQRANGKPLTVVGNGKQRRDFVHVYDVCNAFLLAAETDKSGMIWNVGSGESISVGNLASLISDSRVYIPDRPGEPRKMKADVFKIQFDLKWNPKVKFEDGVQEMLDHLEEWKDGTVWTPETIANETEQWFKCLSK